MSKVYISDTNILIDIRNAGLLDAMFRLPVTFCCTDFVFKELQDFSHGELLDKGLLVEAFNGEAVRQLYNLRIAHNNSSLADVSCYLLAKNTGYPLLTGDGHLRRQAKADGLRVHGALWLLDSLLEHDIIPTHDAATALDLMLVQGARLPKEECQSRLSRWRMN